MDNQSISSEILKEVERRADKRFVVDTKSPKVEELSSIAPIGLRDNVVIRLRRVSNEFDTWRTLMIALVDNLFDELTNVITWAADVRKALIEPETADLYLIIASPTEGVDPDECVRIEATEQFCRKYVMRPNESVPMLLDRTFLAKVEEVEIEASFQDPVELALGHTSIEYSWLSNEVQKHWLEEFLAKKSGASAVNVLFEMINDQQEL